MLTVIYKFSVHNIVLACLSGDVAQWVWRLTHYRSVMSLNPAKGSHFFLEPETLPLLLSTGWFHEQTEA